MTPQSLCIANIFRQNNLGCDSFSTNLDEYLKEELHTFIGGCVGGGGRLGI